MDKKGGLFLSGIVLIVVFLIGIYIGMQTNVPFLSKSWKLEKQSDELKSQIEDLQVQLSGTPSNDKESCEASGGRWGIWSNAVNAVQSCNLPTSDAGAPCTDFIQCNSYCQAESSAEIGSQGSGTCYAWQTTICMKEVREGIVQAEWCQ